jgi:polar amino acid transport system substrate-binding protein
MLAALMSPANAASTELIQKLQKDEAIYNSLPEKVKSSGVINAATEADYAPFEYIDEKGELAGADIDLSAGLSRILGVEIKNNKTEFSNIMPGLQAGRFDIGISSMGDYLDREKTMDFIDYYQGGTSFLIRAGTPKPTALTDLCGTTMGVLKGTDSEKRAQDNSKTCVSGGKAAIQVNSYPTQNDAVLALNSGRVIYVSGDGATNGYSAQQVGQSIENVPSGLYGGKWIAGIAVPKGSALYQPIFNAMAVLMKSGVYDEILKKWGLEAGAMSAPGKNMGIPH